MSKQLSFSQAKESYLDVLEQYVPVVSRVHGENHPEFYDVHKLFNTINRKIKEAGSDKPELKEDFTKLREITKEYTVPGGVCESYEAVYSMLAKLDKAYHV
jgi:iron-sulfur cluster repair protein YtfE (RIC family)